MSNPFHTASPHRRRFDLCGDHMAAIVLERLTFWWARGTRILHGAEWRAKPRNQLVEETGLSETQVRRALEKLKDRSLVETSQHRFAGSVGPVMHYRLLPRAMVLLEGSKRAGSETPVSVTGDQHLDHMAGIVTGNSYVTPKGVPPELPVSEAGSEVGVSGKDCEGEVMAQGLPKKSSLNASAKAPNPKLGMSAAEIIATKSKTGLYPGQKAKKGPPNTEGVWSKDAA